MFSSNGVGRGQSVSMSATAVAMAGGWSMAAYVAGRGGWFGCGYL